MADNYPSVAVSWLLGSQKLLRSEPPAQVGLGVYAEFDGIRSANIQTTAGKVGPGGKELIDELGGEGVELFDLVATPAILPLSGKQLRATVAVDVAERHSDGGLLVFGGGEGE